MKRHWHNDKMYKLSVGVGSYQTNTKRHPYANLIKNAQLFMRSYPLFPLYVPADWESSSRSPCDSCELEPTHLKKSSLQKTCPDLTKHLSASLAPQSAQMRHELCQHRSSTFRINRSTIGFSHPPHFGIVAENETENGVSMDRRWKRELEVSCELLAEAALGDRHWDIETEV